MVVAVAVEAGAAQGTLLVALVDLVVAGQDRTGQERQPTALTAPQTQVVVAAALVAAQAPTRRTAAMADQASSSSKCPLPLGRYSLVE
jgi:hypothetical protein